MQKFEGVANTLFVPLVARITISGNSQSIFMIPKHWNWSLISRMV